MKKDSNTAQEFDNMMIKPMKGRLEQAEERVNNCISRTLGDHMGKKLMREWRPSFKTYDGDSYKLLADVRYVNKMVNIRIDNSTEVEKQFVLEQLYWYANVDSTNGQWIVNITFEDLGFH
eukprot:1770039-Lingulodinium_polyedra.AAC.1